MKILREIYSLECYNEQGEGDPTIGFYSSAKGFMGNFILETNEPFDPKYLFKGQIESNLDFFINVFFYGRTIDELEQLDWNDGPEGEGKSLLHNLGYGEWLDTPPGLLYGYLKILNNLQIFLNAIMRTYATKPQIFYSGDKVEVHLLCHGGVCSIETFL